MYLQIKVTTTTPDFYQTRLSFTVVVQAFLLQQYVRCAILKKRFFIILEIFRLLNNHKMCMDNEKCCPAFLNCFEFLL